MKKILSLLCTLLVCMTLTGCQRVTYEYTLSVNEDNPLKSLYFISENKASPFLAYFTIKDVSSLYMTTHQIVSSGNTKLVYTQIEDSTDYTPDQFEIASYINHGGKKDIEALLFGEAYNFMFSASLSTTYKNYNQKSSQVILKSPFNRLKSLKIQDFVGFDQFLTIEFFRDYYVLDVRFNLNENRNGFLNVSVLALKDDTLYDLTIDIEENTVIEQFEVSSQVLDAYYEIDQDAIIYINEAHELHYLNADEETLIIELSNQIFNFYPVKAYHEGSALRYHVIDTSSAIQFYDTTLTLIDEIPKDPNLVYVGLNHFALDYEAWITLYYLDDDVLLKSSSAISALK